MILTNNLFTEECSQILEQARVHADEVHQMNAAHPPGTEAVPSRIHTEIITPQVF